MHKVICQQHFEVGVHSKGNHLCIEGRWIADVFGYTLTCNESMDH